MDRHTAEEALGLIRVDYEQLPYVLTVEDALKEGAPRIHPEGNLDKQVLQVRDRQRRGRLSPGGFRLRRRLYQPSITTTPSSSAA